MPARRYATTWEKPTLRIAAQFDSWSHFPKAIIRHQFRLRRSPCGSLRQRLRPYHNMKTQPSFKELATAFVAAGSPGAPDEAFRLILSMSKSRKRVTLPVVMEIETDRRINEKGPTARRGRKLAAEPLGGIDRTRADLVRRYYWTQLDEFCTLST
jgi:hypothetical protein